MTAQDFAAWVAPFAAQERESRAEAVRLARSLSKDQLPKLTGDTGWCVRDELAHIASADADFVVVLGAIVAGEKPDTSVFADIDGKNARHLEARRGRSMDEIGTELEEYGRSMLELLARLTDADEPRQPDGVPFTLGGLLSGYFMHAPYHLGQIHAALGEAQEAAAP